MTAPTDLRRIALVADDVGKPPSCPDGRITRRGSRGSWWS